MALATILPKARPAPSNGLALSPGTMSSDLSVPISPMSNVDPQMDEIQALVRQSREDQAVISSKILSLKRGGLTPSAALSGPGFGQPGAASDEVRSLREQLAATDSLLLERDAEVETLKSQVRALLVQVEEPKAGAAWRHRYEDAQKKLEANRKDYEGLQIEAGHKQREIVNLSSYLRILEVDKVANAEQRERLVGDVKSTREQLRVLQVERDSLGRQLRSLEEGFLRCVGRITQSLASGVSTVIINDRSPEARFIVLRLGSSGDGVLEVFREPDAHDEVIALDLSISGGARCIADKQALSILLSGAVEDARIRLCCVGTEEYMKWVGSLRLVGFPLRDALPRV